MDELEDEDFLSGMRDSQEGEANRGLNAGSLLSGSFGKAFLETEGDYYSIMPFGADPPVPHIPPVNITSNGLYNQVLIILYSAPFWISSLKIIRLFNHSALFAPLEKKKCLVLKLSDNVDFERFLGT